MIQFPAPAVTPGRRLTLFDIAIADAIYPVLLAVVRARELVTFKDLAARAARRCADPDHPMHRQLPRAMGRRLEALRRFTQPRGYPDLTCVVVNGKGVVPAAYGDPDSAQARVAAFDWSQVDEELGLQLDEWRQALHLPARRTREDAKALMSAYHSEHGERLHPAITEHRDEIIAELKAGGDVADVFAQIDADLRASEGEPA